jgi:hypothetical protein
MKPYRKILVALLGVIVLWGGYRAYRAHTNLVTLNVRNMEVRRVVSKLRWQTWEHIVVSKHVGGNVTLNVHNVPLEEVLNIIGLQTDSRWTRLYPIYSTGKSLVSFNRVLQGDLAPAGSGWLALQQIAAWQQAGLGGFANTLRAENKLVSAQFANQDLTFTALALSRFSKAQVVPEDGLKGLVNLRLQQVPFDKAVAKVAGRVRHKWNRVYTLQPLNAGALVMKAGPAAAGTYVSGSDTNQVATTTPQAEALAPERALEALTSTMTPEERQQTLDQISSAIQGGGGSSGGAGGAAGGGQQAMQAASPAAAAAAQEDPETRIENRLKNGTIDQRLAHDRRTLPKPSKP